MWRPASALLLLLSLMPAAAARADGPRTPRPAAAPDATIDPARLHVLMINGGGSPEENFRSHVLHLEELLALLGKAGVRRDRIGVLASDGDHPDPDVATRGQDPRGFWLLGGSGVEDLLQEPIDYESTDLPGFEVLPATRASVHGWFTDAREHLRPGDTLLLYVTDHGKDDPRDPRRNHITLWGPRESLTVRQLTGELERLPEGVRVVSLMSQCFSGGFAHLLDVRAQRKLPSGAACGYFASTEDRPAFGCYPEASRLDRSGHSFAMFDGLVATGSLQAAHAQTLVTDQTPDVPLRTSDAFLSELLRRAAEASGEDEDDLTERMLASARRLPGVDELALVDRIAAAFGLAHPSTLVELDAAQIQLAEGKRRLDAHRELWDTALTDMTAANYRRLLAARPKLAARLRPAAVRRLKTDDRRALTREVIDSLSAFADEDPDDRRRLDTLRDKADAAAAAAYRTEVREAVLLRMRTLLVSAAGDEPTGQSPTVDASAHTHAATGPAGAADGDPRTHTGSSSSRHRAAAFVPALSGSVPASVAGVGGEGHADDPAAATAERVQGHRAIPRGQHGPAADLGGVIEGMAHLAEQDVARSEPGAMGG